ncbi:hypothetical protein KY385_01310, partial [Candidatus Parcubacteria bacterium]|nr:hypothetical protein [Candidatus Parcubacteria bacterium]
MNPKRLKQKLLNKRSWIVAAAAVVTFSMFTSFIGLANPVRPKAFAQSNLEQAANRAGDAYVSDNDGNDCPRSSLGVQSDMDDKLCKETFVAGYLNRPKPNYNKFEQDLWKRGNANKVYADGVATRDTDDTRRGAEAACKEAKDEGASIDCYRGYAVGLKGMSKEDACNNAVYDIRACRAGWDAGAAARSSERAAAQREAAKADEADDPGESELANCDIKLLNPMSWIICPIIDIGASLSDTVFQDVVKPLLSDVPV